MSEAGFGLAVMDWPVVFLSPFYRHLCIRFCNALMFCFHKPGLEQVEIKGLEH